VLPARLLGVRADTGAKVQGLYVSPGSATESELRESGGDATDTERLHRGEPIIWNVLLKMRRFRPGTSVTLIGADGQATGVSLRLLSRAIGDDGAETGGWNVLVEGVEAGSVGSTTPEILSRVGHTPLPPYILSARKHLAETNENETDSDGGAVSIPDSADRERYQTVYADPAQGQSVAAPTAGLHFTPELLKNLQSLGVRTASVVLHVGLGTFKPVETEFVEQHPMHSEWCMLPAETSRAIIETRKRGGRVIAVGTTAARTLESFDELKTEADVSDTGTNTPLSQRGGTQEAPSQAGQSHHTRLLITPGYSFKHLDGLLTNFHLPRSTLIALVAALLGSDETGVPRLIEMYRSAIQHEYRFYSFGDAMLILP
jgi:S-adenosylmethionine:tRNA ribosyltransferase-isomerase